MMRLEHQTLNDRTYDAIKQGLISGQFKPGEILVIRKLAEGFGISTTPIREALQRLVAERILEIRHNRSIAVPLLSAAGFQELVQIRCAVEGLAGQLATAKIGEPQLQALLQSIDGMDEAINRGDSRRYLALNEEFHFAIYRQSEAPILLGYIRDLWGRVGPYMNYLLEIASYIPQSNLHHQQIYAAIKKHNETAVRELIVTDIADAAIAIAPFI